MGTQKNRLIETVLLSIENMFKMMDKKSSVIYAQFFSYLHLEVFQHCFSRNQHGKLRRRGSMHITLYGCSFVVCRFFKLFQKSLPEISSMSNSLDPDQAPSFISSDLGQNCLQRLSVDDKSCHKLERVKI